MDRQFVNQGIGQNLRGFAGGAQNEIKAKMAANTFEIKESGITGQIRCESEVSEAFSELSRRLDHLEVSLSGLVNRLEPVLKLDQPQVNDSTAPADCPAYAASKMGQGVLAAAHRVNDVCRRVDELLQLLAV